MHNKESGGPSRVSRFFKEHLLKIETVKKGAELREAIAKVSQDKGLSPTEVEQFLSNEKPTGFELSDAAISGALFVLYLATLSILNRFGSTLPELGQLPPGLHSIFQAFHSVTVNSAESPALRDHLPYLFLESSLVYAGGKTLITKLMKKILGTGDLIELQEKVRTQKTEGSLPVKMDEGHTAIFSGDGDILATLLRKNKGPNDATEYANKKINKDIWHRFSLGEKEEVYKSLDQGDFLSAGEVLILPVKKEHMFLAPQDGGHDMELSEIEGLIAILDSYCEARNIPKKKIIIVGRKSYSETQSESELVGKKIKEDLSQKTLGQLEEDKNYAERLSVIDPTEIVMKKVLEIVGNRRVRFHATGKSAKIYRDDFLKTLKNMGHSPSDQKSEPIVVYYNISDIPTSVGANGENSIAIILDSSQKDAILKKGVPENRILVVPEMVNEVLVPKVDET
ncbi:MAG: hypothetical protein GW942_00340 [Candidatus Pacebacteria bacterium]|nr:hypothetical protein [Candidatus Paceibacterota bacterium]NCQ65985.1 hypothetical protein [Candidatus Paceibacterota bacterium]PIQ81164.1 MAG: hypothetical protein COV78_01730 [Candidatus Pacebacteria bacterium CG11_big_fil_rev_8_21_14_0_20_34_55]PIX81312.1 MAG: hypothetical protein COZ34_03970 [Candidatus Pacebacteria bacterium CG_4_10_14_3_um_filter_34_15]PJC43387.1 MAG: hypothetical protein CO039_04435 [Candidatus Pacebacteria bacterium CG_4_9_14_0_2_um_filter_34_50]